MRAVVIVILLALARAAAADQLELAARVGVNGSSLYNENLDSPIEGSCPFLGLELGWGLEHFHPALVVDFGQYHGSGINFETAIPARERVGHLLAKLRVDIGAGFDISAMYGGTLDMEHIYDGDRHTFGWTYGLGVGLEVWHDGRQGVRIDVTATRAEFHPDGIELEMTQLGGSVGYTLEF